MSIDLRLVAGVLAASLLTSGSARGQEPSPSPPPVEEPTLDDTIEAGEADAEEPARRRIDEVERIRRPLLHDPGRGRLPLRGRRLLPGRGERGAVPRPRAAKARSATPASSSRGASSPSGSGRSPIRPGSCTTAPPTSSWCGRPGSWWQVPGAVGPFLHRPHQGRLLPQQGHGRLRGLDDGARHDQRRHHPDPGRRHQVARLAAQAAHPVEPRRLRRTGSPRGRASRPTTTSSSAAWPGFRSRPRRRPRPCSTSG